MTELAAEEMLPGDTAPIATVGGRPIPRERLERRMAELRQGPRGRHLPPDGASGPAGDVARWMVQELVTEEVLAQAAEASGIMDVWEGVADGLVQARSARMSPGATSLLFERVTADARVSRRDVRAYYVRNADLYRRREARRVRHVLTRDEPAARSIVERLAAGDEMAWLARTDSTDPRSAARGGDLRDVHRGELSGALEDAIFAATPGTVIGPIPTELGWHVVRVEDVRPASCVPYADARPTIEAELLAAARIEAFARWLERRRAETAVIEPAFEHPAHPIHGFTSHRH